MQRALLAVARFALGVFYRREAFGAGVPGRGPLILVANHPNGLVDPILLATTTSRTVRFLGKAPLFDLPVLGTVLRGLRALPVYRTQDGADTGLNRSTFEAVFAALRAGEVVCMFPEGTSHSEPSLRQLKTGAARMALGARAAGARGVRVVPVGLVYRARRRFRSRVATCVGPPIGTDDLAETWARDEREAVQELTERIAGGLRAVTLTLERWEDLPLLELAAAVWRPRRGERLTVLHEFAAGVHRLRASHPEHVEGLARRVTAFRDRLLALGLGPESIHARYSVRGVARFAIRNLAVLVLVPLALVGAALWLVPYWLSPLVPRLIGPSRDVHATVQILAGMVLFPLWWLGLGAVAAWAGGPGWAAAMLAIGPLLGLAALALYDWRHERADDVRAFLLLAHRRSLRELLARERDSIADEIEALAAELAASDGRGPEASS